MAKGLNRFPKSSRLHLRKEINELFTSGKSIQAAPLRAVYKILPESGVPIRLAIAVPKRSVKLAVNRNRIKRQLREAFRLNCHAISEHLTQKGIRVQVIVVYNGKIYPDYAILESKIILILQRLLKITE